jgi:hypothetical protein
MKLFEIHIWMRNNDGIEEKIYTFSGLLVRLWRKLRGR